MIRRWAPVLVAAALCLGTIGRWCLWQDEAFTWAVTQRDVAAMVDAAAKDRHPPLYYLVVAPFHRLSDFDWFIRLPSALAFIAAVAVLRRGVARHFGESAGTLAALVLALSPFAVLFAHTARMYALLLFFGTVLFTAGIDLVRGERPGRAALWVLIGAAGAAWTHYAGFAAIAATGLATAAAVTANSQLPGRERARRLALLGLALGLAAASFAPWATGPLQYQLANKDAPAARTWKVLAYVFWAFDARLPALSWVLLGLQALGVAIAVRRRDTMSVYLLGWIALATVAPWLASRSQPAQNPRNYIDFLPLGATLAGLALDALPGGLRRRVAAFAIVAAFPLADLLSRPVSPQETGTAYDYHREATAFASAMPSDGHAIFRPAYMLTQYQRYEAWLGQASYGVVGPDAGTWMFLARGERLDSGLLPLYPEDCTFRHAFKVVAYAPAGPGCEAMKAMIAADDTYVPFLIEMAQRALSAGQLEAAEGYAAKAAARLRAHPTAAMLLAQIRMRLNRFEDAAEAAGQAADISLAWGFPAGVSAEALLIRANALAAINQNDASLRTRTRANCVRSAYRPALCGTPLSWLARAVTEPTGPLPPGAPPAPELPTLPVPSEPQDPAAPAAAPTGMERVALWRLDGEALPGDWSVLDGEVSMAADALVASATRARPTGVACAPFVPAATPLVVRARWRTELDPGEGRAWMVLEARGMDAAGAIIRVGGAPAMSRPLQSPAAMDWRVDRVDYFPPEGATQVRFCVKADGTVPARAVFDWIEVSKQLDGGP